MTNPFYTIGHSTRTIPDFVDLLREANVQLVVDVRTVPRSRTNPQFNRDALPESLAGYQIGYLHIAELGGLRGRQRQASPSPNAYWENASFRNYADYALTDTFRTGLATLHDLGIRSVTAMMCAEAVWWRCHRRIIADYLLASGHVVFHILGPGKIGPASLTPGARLTDEGILYPGRPEPDPSGGTEATSRHIS
jgi:uncharacterized protein (DUF488 family)